MSGRQLSVGARLALGFGIVLGLLAAVALTSLGQLAGFNRNVEALATTRLLQLITVAQASDSLGQITRSTGNVLVLDDEKQVKAELVAVRQHREHIAELLNRLGKTVLPGREQDLLKEIADARAAYLPQEDAFLQHAEHGDYSSAKDVLLKNVLPAQARLLDAMDRFEQFQVSLAADEARVAADAYHGTRLSIVALSVVALLVGLAAAWLIIRRLRSELGGEPAYARAVAVRIAGGDLTGEVRTDARGGDSLLHAMGKMAGNLRQLAGAVAAGAHTVSETSTQIAQGHVDLSQRTEEQAGTLEETATAMDELTAAVSRNAESARQASQFAVSASEVARRGGEAMGQVARTMGGITASSNRIADITGVIDAIAFQTNILALNAAVEAARAGEQGRGFAVVAAEVRNLAQRSAAAAREIKALIADSAGQVEAGAQQVEAAGGTMEEIVASVKKVSELIGEIAASSQEQSVGIEQVNRAVSQMEQVVQQNATLVEQASAATEAMKEQAGSLLEAVARFRLRQEGAAMPALA
ncbi:methyl-accepting chemotaxis protein [Ramlibacter sp. G-1-2-2]|uniref:Methyl-accepting chemotaxis protein n=1 Tax=Ramlibacter agri TaxID=2728837 RepID=A0A848HA46_9BURK|nr:methyl-accepting chemotaxis protein [Ramlibacter agri]NML46320.1 methyl-accepting chemotaxis protein [Ramlibacter agri]